MSTVYFIRAANGTGPIKIGLTDFTSGRLSALQAGSPILLEVVAELPAMSRYAAQHIETLFHRRFADARLHGEWFVATPELLAEIEVIRAGHWSLSPSSRTHSEIVAAADCAKIAEMTRAASIHTVRSWGQRNSIPAEHWPAFVEIGAATLEELAAGVKPRKPARAAA